MAVQKCPDCAANMILVNNRDGTTSYHCEYCGKTIDIHPETTADKLFTFAKRAVNAISDRVDPIRQQEAFLEDLRRIRDNSTGKKRARLERQIAVEERNLEYYKKTRNR